MAEKTLPTKNVTTSKRPNHSVRRNLEVVRPPTESQKTLKKDADKKIIDVDSDEVRKLHGGAFGQVYSAQDQHMDNGWVAVKVESLKCPAPLLSLETTVLRSVQGRPHSPMYIATGRIDDAYNYLAMQLVGPNLDALRRRCPFTPKQFSISTAVRLALQCLDSIQDLHIIGWIHRDIKASNFAIGGSTSTSTVVYLLDYGLCREHISNGKIRAERRTAGFRGTVRYASKATHGMKDLGRKDDLWSLFYTLMEWFSGTLPWSNEADAGIAYELKRSTPFEELVPNEPPVLRHFAKVIGNYLESLNYADAPDYKYIETMLRRVCEAVSVRDTDQFDWQNEFAFLVKTE